MCTANWWRQAAILDLGCGLTSATAPTSLGAAELLESMAVPVNVNKLLMPLMLEGDADGSFAAACVHELLMRSASGGMLALKEADFYHLYTAGLKTVSDALCGARPGGAPMCLCLVPSQGI